MLFAALLLTTLAVQQPAAAPAKPQTNATQHADTSKTKHKARRTARKAKHAAPAPAQRDTTKKP